MLKEPKRTCFDDDDVQECAMSPKKLTLQTTLSLKTPPDILNFPAFKNTINYAKWTGATPSGFNATEKYLMKYSIVGLLIGGSAAYNPSKTSRDWDGLIIVRDYNSIINLLSDGDALSELLEVEISAKQMWWSTNGPLVFDAARFCGYTPSGSKKSVKIVAADHLKSLLQQSRTEPIKILSQKDVRLYSTSYQGGNYWRVQPVTSISDRLFILHDADIFVSPKDQKGYRYASFGCTMDMLLTGKWVFSIPSTELLPEYAMRKYIAISNVWMPDDWTTIFSRNTRFPDLFRKALHSRGWETFIPTPSLAPFAMPGNIFWPEDSAFLDSIVRSLNCEGFQDEYDQLLSPPDSFDEEQWISSPVHSQFSSNSTASKLSCVHDPRRLVFRKQTSQWEAERDGASRLRVLGVRVHQPLHFDPEKSAIYYPWFPGTTIADLRAEYFGLPCSSPKSIELFRVILEAEIRKAEDMLSLYCASLGHQESETNIQRFFCDRLRNNERMHQLYPEGLVSEK